MAQARRNFGSALICGRNPAGRHGVSTESGSDRVKADSNNRDCQDYYPVATALGTDLILKLGHYQHPAAFDSQACSKYTKTGFQRRLMNQRSFQVGSATFGDGRLAIIAGPCVIESREDAL